MKSHRKLRSGDRLHEEAEDAAPYKRRKHEGHPDPRAPVSDLGAKSEDGSSELEARRRAREECKEGLGAQLDDISRQK